MSKPPSFNGCFTPFISRKMAEVCVFWLWSHYFWVCYLIRQKFKLTSFSIACWGLAVLYRMGFGNFSMEERNLFWGVVVGKEGNPFTWAWGSICFSRKVCHEIESLEPCEGDSQGADGRRTGPTIAYSHHGAKEEVWKVKSQSVCVPGPLIHYSAIKHIVRLVKAFCRSSTNVQSPRLWFEAHVNRMFLLSLSIHSRQELAWWLTEHGNTGLLHI